MIFQAVIAFCIILCIIIAILIYYSELDFTLKLVSLPFSVFFLSAFIYWVSDNLGTPVEGIPIGEFKYIHHTMKGNETIYLWIYLQATLDLQQETHTLNDQSRVHLSWPS